MSTQYSGGTYVNTTFTGDSKVNIVNNMLTQLLKAGWTVVSGAIAPPGAPTIAGSGSGGTLAAATYLYAVTAVNATGETTIGTASASYVASGSTSSVALSAIPTPSGATQRKVYRSTDGGATWLLVNTIADNTTTTWTDTGATTGAAAPTVNTTSAATPNVLMQTAQASGSNNQGRVRFKDNAGTCIQVTIENVAGTKAQTASTAIGGYILPGAAKTYRVLASKFRFEVFTPGASAPREFCCAGILYIPTPYQGVITEAIYMQGNANSDSDTTQRTSFRYFLGSQAGNNSANCAGIVNNSLMDLSNQTQTWESAVALRVPTCASLGTYNQQSTGGGFASMYRWHDLAIDMCDPLMGWGLASSTDEALIRGQVYDWTIIGDSFSPDLTDTWSDGGTSHTWYSLTSNNTGNSGNVRGTIWVATS